MLAQAILPARIDRLTYLQFCYPQSLASHTHCGEASQIKSYFVSLRALAKLYYHRISPLRFHCFIS